MIWFKSISSFLTIGIILLHSAVPHYHENEVSEQGHYVIHAQDEDGVVDQIAFAFHEQPTSSHLKEFEPFGDENETQLDNEIPSTLVLQSDEPTLFYHQRITHFNYLEEARNAELMFSGLRGPPFCS